MTFKAQLTADLAAFFNTDEFAEAWTYKAGGTGAGVAVKVLPSIGAGGGYGIQPVTPPGARMEIDVMVSEVANPQFNDTFTDAGGGVWYLRGEPGGGPSIGIWTLTVSKSDKRVL